MIGNTQFDKAMLDFGASINIMPYSIYASLNLGSLKKTGVLIELADCFNIYPKGVVEDILVQVNKLVLSVDFYILKMENDLSLNTTSLFLGRPLMNIAHTKTDVHAGTLSMENDEEVQCFNIFEEDRYPSDLRSCFSIDKFDFVAQ